MVAFISRRCSHDVRYICSLTDAEREELERMKQQAVGRVAMRAHMILLSAKGFSVPDITTIHDVTEVTVYKWFDRFETEGPEGLYDRPRSGRPPEVDETVEAELEDAVEQSPTEFEYTFTRWTVPTLVSHLAETLGIELSRETVRQTLHALGFRWRRPRWFQPREDPEAGERMRAITDAILTAGDDTVLLVEDETLFRSLPPLRNMWMRRGQQVRVPTPKQNNILCLYGTLELDTGNTVTASYYERPNSDYTITFLKHLLQQYPESNILLIWDQAQFHVSQKTRGWLAEHERFDVYLLPRYAPQANPLETVWQHLKNRIAANLTRSVQTLQAVSETFFDRLNSADVLKMAGLPIL